MMYVLGINSAYHEPSACLLKNGIPVAAIEEERFSRFRHGKEANPFNSWQLPFNAINFCLKEAGITINDVDLIAYSFKPGIRLAWRAAKFLPWLLSGKGSKMAEELALYYFNSRPGEFLASAPPKRQEVRKRFVVYGKQESLGKKVVFVEHHLAHAASAFFASPFREAAILSIDGIGERAATLLADGKGNKISKVKEFRYPDSLGFFYEEITEFLGFRRNNDEYKVMALAAEGRPRYASKLRKLVEVGNGSYLVRMDFERGTLFGCKELRGLLGAPRLWGGPLKQRHRDIAASAQKVLEEAVLEILDALHRETKTKNLCIAGGVGLNCVMNRKIRDGGRFKNIFVQPACNDAGTALGAALYVWNHLFGNKREYVMNHCYLGPEFSDSEIEVHLKRSGLRYRKSANVAKECAGLIANGKIVAWFQGRMEFGPRALGNRSIIADSRNAKMKDVLNSIKGREEFRPLAPAVLEERAADYFENFTSSPFMLFAFKVKKQKRAEIPAAVHSDNTARIQSVSKEQNPRFHALIREFERLTHVPVVINTSLNYAGKPIVCTPQEALECFYNTAIDCLAIGNFVVEK